MSQRSHHRPLLVQTAFALVSLGLHSAVLMWPIAPQKIAKDVEPKTVKIIRIPRSSRLPAKPLAPIPPVGKLPAETQVKPKPLVAPAISPPPPLGASIPLSAPSTPPAPKVIPTKIASPQSETFDDFPVYPNAQVGSCGLLQGEQNTAAQQTKDALEQVAQYFEQELPKRDYIAKPGLKDPKGQGYQVSKGGAKQFLNLMICPDQGTVIALTNQPINFKKLQNTAVSSQAEAAFDIVLKQLNQLGAQRIDVPEFYFVQPDAFFAKFAKDPKSYDTAKPHVGFNGDFVIILDKSPQQLFESFFAPNLKNNGFSVFAAPSYGGGLVYEIKQSTLVRYLNLLPTQTGTGTIIVVWDRPPS